MKICSSCKKENKNVKGDYCVYCGGKLEEKEIKKGKIIKNIKKSDNNAEEKRLRDTIKKYKIVFFALITIIALLIVFLFWKNRSVNVEKNKDSIVMIKTYDEDGSLQATGSGFCAVKENYIVTNYHVLEGAYKVEIVTDDNQSYTIRDIKAFNYEDDLAIISGNFNLKPLKLVNEAKLKAGDPIIAIGSPKGQLNTVSTGNVSNADSDYDIRITAPISPGSSGGPLLDKSGKVVGIVFATYDSEDSQNINYAINIKYLNKLINALKEKNTISITSSDWVSYIGSLDNFNSYYFSKGKYYSISSIATLYKMTNEQSKFEYLIKKDSNSWYNIYNSLNNKNKKKVIELFQEMDSFEIDNKITSEKIKKWSIEDFFLNLRILNKYKLSVAVIDLNNYKNMNKNLMFEHVRKDYSVEVAEKVLILYLIGDYPLSDISDKNKQDVIDYLYDYRFYNVKHKKAILNLLGL